MYTFYLDYSYLYFSRFFFNLVNYFLEFYLYYIDTWSLWIIEILFIWIGFGNRNFILEDVSIPISISIEFLFIYSDLYEQNIICVVW